MAWCLIFPPEALITILFNHVIVMYADMTTPLYLGPDISGRLNNLKATLRKNLKKYIV